MDESYESVSQAVLAAVNAYPGLKDGEKFTFAGMDQESGLAVFPKEGQALEEEHRSVTGRVKRLCRWPFTVACRAGGPGQRQRESAAAWMDALGRWLEGQTVSVGGRDHCLAAYPALTGRRRLTAIRRAGVPRQAEADDDRAQIWVMDMTARYETITN